MGSHLQGSIGAGGLMDLWQRTATILLPWYEAIAAAALASATLHADETSWRVDGRTHWLWCFCNHSQLLVHDRPAARERRPPAVLHGVLHRDLLGQF